MPQPGILDEIQDPLLAAYRRAWEQVQAEQQRLIADPLRALRRARLIEMRRAIEQQMAELDALAAEWIAKRLPQAYAMGGVIGAEAAGSSFTWSQIHGEAVQRLATELFNELLDATSGVTDTTKALIRSVARDEALQAAITGQTATQASTEMRRLLEDRGISAITYKDGSVHGLREYSQVAIRTATAKAYNSGTLNGAASAGVRYWEILDGPECGLSFHDDPTRALGMVVSKRVAEKYLISHPNCRRAFGARPDVTTAAEAKQAQGNVTAEQTEAQREQDRTRRERARRVSRAKARRARQEARKAEISATRRRRRTRRSAAPLPRPTGTD